MALQPTFRDAARQVVWLQGGDEHAKERTGVRDRARTGANVADGPHGRRRSNGALEGHR